MRRGSMGLSPTGIEISRMHAPLPGMVEPCYSFVGLGRGGIPRGQNPDPQVGEQGPLEIFRVSVQGLRLPIFLSA